MPLGARSGILTTLVLAVPLAWNAHVAPVHAQEISDLADKLDRVERDLRDLQYEVYKGDPSGQSGAAAPAPGGAPSSARLNDLEQSLRELRGQVETMSFEMKRLSEQLELTRRETSYRLGALEGGAPASQLPPTAAMPAAPARAVTPASPAGSNQMGQGAGSLGSIQADDIEGTQVAAATPRQQYDAAMEMLTRAQYPEAQGAFRSFVAANPTDELAGPAQFWVGDIAFTQKDYQVAAKAFADVIRRYAKTTKAPEAMLKLGLSLMELGKTKDGCMTLAAIKTRYPAAPKPVLDRAAKRIAEGKCAAN